MLYNVILSFEAALIVDIFPAGTSTDLILTVMTHRGSVDGKHRLQSMHKGAVLLHEIHRSNKAVLALLRTDAHLIILVVIGYGLGFLTQDILLDRRHFRASRSFGTSSARLHILTSSSVSVNLTGICPTSIANCHRPFINL